MNLESINCFVAGRTAARGELGVDAWLGVSQGNIMSIATGLRLELG